MEVLAGELTGKARVMLSADNIQAFPEQSKDLGKWRGFSSGGGLVCRKSSPKSAQLRTARARDCEEAAPAHRSSVADEHMATRGPDGCFPAPAPLAAHHLSSTSRPTLPSSELLLFPLGVGGWAAGLEHGVGASIP